MNPTNQQPETAEAINNRGEAKRKQGDLDGALEDFNKVIEMKPDAVGPYNNRGLVRQAKGDFDGAIFDFSKVIELKPDAAISSLTISLLRTQSIQFWLLICRMNPVGHFELYPPHYGQLKTIFRLPTWILKNLLMRLAKTEFFVVSPKNNLN
jgi:tetratricopeptide (TPR) repeat protein